MSNNNNVLATAFVNVVPNMNGFESAVRTHLNGINFAPMGKDVGKEIGEGISNSVSKQLKSADLKSEIRAG